MKPGESLLICTKAFAPACKDRHASVTIKKIPQIVLGKCEFGKDNYNLNIIDLPKVEEDEETVPLAEQDLSENAVCALHD